MISVSDLRALKALTAFTDADLKLLSSQSRARALKKGDVLYAQGESAKSAFLLVHGVLQAERARKKAPEIISTIRAGVFVGQVALLDGGKRSATVRAQTDSEGLEISRSEFDALLAGSTPLCLAFADQVAVGGIRQFRSVMNRLAALPTREQAVELRRKQLTELNGTLGEWGADLDVGDIEVVTDVDQARNWKRG